LQGSWVGTGSMNPESNTLQEQHTLSACLPREAGSWVVDSRWESDTPPDLRFTPVLWKFVETVLFDIFLKLSNLLTNW
jgi:hypothetical protein